MAGDGDGVAGILAAMNQYRKRNDLNAQCGDRSIYFFFSFQTKMRVCLPTYLLLFFFFFLLLTLLL